MRVHVGLIYPGVAFGSQAFFALVGAAAVEFDKSTRQNQDSVSVALSAAVKLTEA